MEFEFDEKAE
jgi:hypothetical protein